MVTIRLNGNETIEFPDVDPEVFEESLRAPSYGGWIYMQSRDGAQIAVPTDQVLYIINDEA